MRHRDSSISPRAVRFQALGVLRESFPWASPVRAVSVDQLLRVLLLAATTCGSIHSIVSSLFSFGLHGIYRAFLANCHSTEATTHALNQALHTLLARSRLDRTQPCLLALDSHFVPYYGDRVRTPGLMGGQRKAGTKFFHGYATAILLRKRRRYTVALLPLSPGEKPHELMRRLLDTVAAFGLTVGGVTADSGFDSAETLLLLQERKLAYAIPLRRKGRGSNPRNDLFNHRCDTVHWATWKSEKSRRRVTTAVYVWRRKNSKRGMVVAFSGWTAGAARDRITRAAGRRARDTYRCRFGIETSYRQKNEGRGMTTSRNPVWRLWLEGIAHLLRQVWVLLTEQIAVHRNLTDDAWISDLPLRKLLLWLEQILRESQEIPLGTIPCD